MDPRFPSWYSWFIFQQRDKAFSNDQPDQTLATTGIGQDHAILGNDRSVSVIYSVAVEHL